MDMDYRVEGIPGRWVRWYKGPKGVGAYSVKPDSEGNYKVWYAKPIGIGARQGNAKMYKIVDRFTTTRKSKAKAIDRAYTLAFGGTRRPERAVTQKPSVIGSGDAYCLRQKKHVSGVKWQQKQTKNGRAMLVAECPECQAMGLVTKLTKFGRLIDCPECGEHKEGRANDYICVECRAKA